MLSGKNTDVWHTVGHLPADGVVTLEVGSGRDVLLDIGDDSVKLIKRLGGLWIKVDVAREIELFYILKLGYDYGFSIGLSHQPQHFGMSGFAEYDNLCIGIGIVLLFDASLQLQHYGACGIDYFDVVLLCELVGCWRLAMGT